MHICIYIYIICTHIHVYIYIHIQRQTAFSSRTQHEDNQRRDVCVSAHKHTCTCTYTNIKLKRVTNHLRRPKNMLVYIHTHTQHSIYKHDLRLAWASMPRGARHHWPKLRRKLGRTRWLVRVPLWSPRHLRYRPCVTARAWVVCVTAHAWVVTNHEVQHVWDCVQCMREVIFRVKKNTKYWTASKRPDYCSAFWVCNSNIALDS